MLARPLRILALGVLGLSLHASAHAMPSIPSPANCSAPSRIVLTGKTSLGAPDPSGEFCVTVRDLANLPVGGSLVIVDFAQCPDVRVPTDQSDPAIQYNHCSPASYGKFTPQFVGGGTVCFRLAGVPGSTCPSVAKLRIYADGVLIGSPNVVTLDLDGGGGVNAADVSKWLETYFAGSNCALADFDGNGSLNAADLSSYLQLYFLQSSTGSTSAPYCNP